MIIIFIFSEVLLFFSFFWSGLNSIYGRDLILGFQWPPVGILYFKRFKLPFLNTLLLLISRLILTFFHENLILIKLSIFEFYTSIILGGYFFMLQLFEYSRASFSIERNFIGARFFTFTGFHGGHIIVGGIFLSFVGVFLKMYSLEYFISIEIRIWYWHFVDVVWLFLFCIFYWWGS